MKGTWNPTYIAKGGETSASPKPKLLEMTCGGLEVFNKRFVKSRKPPSPSVVSSPTENTLTDTPPAKLRRRWTLLR